MRIASSRSDCLTGFTSTAAKPAVARARPRRRQARRREQDHLDPAEPLVGADLARQREAVHVGHQRVGEHEMERSACRRRPATARRAPPRALVDSRRLHPPAREHLLEDPPVGRVVVDDEHAQAAQVRGCRRAAGRRRRAAAPKCATKWKRLPRPASLSTQMRPPISSTSCAEIVRPSPVPPYRRVVERRPARTRRRSATACRAGCRCRCRDTVNCSAASSPLDAIERRRRRRPRRAR